MEKSIANWTEYFRRSSLWWICIPISISFPYFWFYVCSRIVERKSKNCLPHKVVVITGASSGIGEALAHVFYKEGCKVVLAARREDELNRVRKDLLELHTTGPTHPPVVIPLDLSDLKSLPLCIDQIINIYGQIDILINNGGISVRSDVASTDIDVDMNIMIVNYFGSAALTKAVLPSMVKRKIGHIVFMSSVQGKIALPFRSAYSASKHAMQAFADSLRAEVAQHGIKVICVSPGYVKTSLSLNAVTGTGAKYGVMDKNTEGGMSPEELAENTLAAILRNDKDVIFAQSTAKLGYYLRVICPSLYFWIMSRRARNNQN